MLLGVLQVKGLLSWVPMFVDGLPLLLEWVRELTMN